MYIYFSKLHCHTCGQNKKKRAVKSLRQTDRELLKSITEQYSKVWIFLTDGNLLVFAMDVDVQDHWGSANNNWIIPCSMGQKWRKEICSKGKCSDPVCARARKPQATSSHQDVPHSATAPSVNGKCLTSKTLPLTTQVGWKSKQKLKNKPLLIKKACVCMKKLFYFFFFFFGLGLVGGWGRGRFWGDENDDHLLLFMWPCEAWNQPLYAFYMLKYGLFLKKKKKKGYAHYNHSYAHSSSWFESNGPTTSLYCHHNLSPLNIILVGNSLNLSFIIYMVKMLIFLIYFFFK